MRVRVCVHDAVRACDTSVKYVHHGTFDKEGGGGAKSGALCVGLGSKAD